MSRTWNPDAISDTVMFESGPYLFVIEAIDEGQTRAGAFAYKARLRCTEGKAEFIPVSVGVAGKDHFEVLSGLSESDSVVAGPYDVIRTLEAGKPVRPMKAAAGGPAAAAEASK